MKQKSSDILRKYRSGQRDFSNVDIRGESFRHENLKGADFSNARIQGCNFAYANLDNTNFSGAQAGLTIKWRVVALILSGISGLLTGFLASDIGFYLYNSDFQYQIIGCLSIIFLFGFLMTSKSQGMGRGIGLLLATLAITGTLTGTFSVFLDEVDIGMLTLEAARTIVLVCAVAIEVFFAETLTKVATNFKWSVLFLYFGAALSAISTPIFTTSDIATVILESGRLGITGMVILSVLLAFVCTNLAKDTLGQETKHRLIKDFAIFIASLVGTDFSNASIENSDFTKSFLGNSNFSSSKLKNNHWYGAIKLGFARLDDTILAEPKVRNLLVTNNPGNADFQGADFSGANLSHLNLRGVNFCEANLSGANLQGACLEGADLTRVRAIGTNFQDAKLTGAYLENWKIDGNTTFDNVECRYIYLENKERNPLDMNENFKDGEFAKVFKKITNTIDILLHNPNWEIFQNTIKQIQVEYGESKLEIASIENKGEGDFLVKVKIDPDLNKAHIDSQLRQDYKEKLDSLEQHTKKLEQINRELSQTLESLPTKISLSAKNRVLLNLQHGSLQSGFSFILTQIWSEGGSYPHHQMIGSLPSMTHLKELNSRWRSVYWNITRRFRGININSEQPTNISIKKLSDDLEKYLNQWLDSDGFIGITKYLREPFNRRDEIQIIIESDDPDVRKLPWHLWDFLKSYRQAYISFSLPYFENKTPLNIPRSSVRILAIIGNTQNLNVKKEEEFLQNLSKNEDIESRFLDNVEVRFLQEVDIQELSQNLRDKKGWDIICFLGHTNSSERLDDGFITINSTTNISIREIQQPLNIAIEKGLQLAIFNSCDGLGLATVLQDLQIPQVVVMRELISDYVAQEFMTNFLINFITGESLHLAVRHAQESLEILNSEYPCADWLPVLCQNPASISLTWQDLLNRLQK